MSKTLDPNHLALMVAVTNARDALRDIIIDVATVVPCDAEQDADLRSIKDALQGVTDRLRLTLKGRI